jgi:biopolymer transport protein ExbD
MIPYRLKRHRKRQHAGDTHMALVPFIDMLTILVVFLLVHTSDVDVVPNTKNISIPLSVSQTKPRETVVVMITKDEVLVNGKSVISIAEVAASTGTIIEPLKQALSSQADRVLATATQENIAEREVTILGDRNLPYNVLKKIMQSCTEANYGKVSLAVLERESAA